MKWERLYFKDRRAVEAKDVPHAVQARAEKFAGSVRPGTTLYIPDTGGNATFDVRTNPCYAVTFGELAKIDGGES